MKTFQDRGVWIRIRFVLRGWIRIRFVLRGWSRIRIRSTSDRIRNPANQPTNRRHEGSKGSCTSNKIRTLMIRGEGLRNGNYGIGWMDVSNVLSNSSPSKKDLPPEMPSPPPPSSPYSSTRQESNFHCSNFWR